ncbi:polysaccharide deacetylase family protein [Leeia oryzae]|uniref:polysaccharide deacetylase family protein n=1 Tax=Leeia oryzae TaxID=356662 RepID=UPI00037A0514|nr:polysaccharide deacetylase family protein [Leeia oryzae]
MNFRHPQAKAIPVLMYHHVTPQAGLVTVSPDSFEAHMRYLSEHGWNTITCDQLADFMADKQALPAKSVLITFDDGYLDNYVYAHPILEKYQQKAALFIVTDWIGDGEPRDIAKCQSSVSCPDHKACKRAIADGHHDEVMLRWSEIEYMQKMGTFEFHSHTHTHTRWDKVDPQNKLASMIQECELSRKQLITHMGRASAHLCWPQGYYESDYQHLAIGHGFSHLYTTEKGMVTPETLPTQIPRVVVKDKPASWLATRLWLFSSPLLGKLYTQLRGQ